MTSYTRTTRAWLEQRFLMRSEAGHYFAHTPIYGVGHPDAEPGHAARLCRISRILRVLDGLAFDTMLDVGGAEGYLGHLAQTIFGVEAATSDLSLEANRRAREIFALPSAAVDCSRRAPSSRRSPRSARSSSRSATTASCAPCGSCCRATNTCPTRCSGCASTSPTRRARRSTCCRCGCCER